MAPAPIELLIESLKKIFTEQKESEERTMKIKLLLQSYVKQGYTDWKKYVNFSDTHYTRNLVEMTDDFELMIICWQKGQYSRIHNHAGSHCWMGIVQGKLIERLYNYITPDGRIVTEDEEPATADGVCPDFHLEKQKTIDVGQVAYASDKIGLHSMHTDGEDAISLHLYSPPITIVKVFDPEVHSAATRKPGFFSTYGIKT